MLHYPVSHANYYHHTKDVVVVFDIDDLVLGVHHLSVFGGGRILEVNVKGGGGGLEILRVIGVNNAPDGRL